jgi:hypothetical protein
MKKYLYIVTTTKTVEQTYAYEFESDEKLTRAQARDYIFDTKNDVKGFHNDLLDKEVEGLEGVVDFHRHENWTEEKPLL